MTLGHWESRKTEVITTYKLFQIQWLPILHHTSRWKTYIIHQDEKTWSNRTILFLSTFIFFNILGIEEKTVEKESLGNEVENNDKVNVREYARNNVTINNNVVTTTMSFLPCVSDDIKVREAVDN